MKKLLPLLLFLITGITNVYSQFLVSIDPANGYRGQSLSTLVTGSGFFFTQGSGPNAFDVYMQKGTTIIGSMTVNILDDDHFTAFWNIPSNVPIGNYNVIWSPFGMGTNLVPGGFNIGDAFISGTVYNDADSSLTQNGTENGMFNKKITLLPDNANAFTNAAGEYMIGTTMGNKTVTVETNNIFNITTGDSVNVNLTSTNVTGIDFGLKATLPFYNIEGTVTGSGTPRCFRDVPYQITYYNPGNTVTHGEVIFSLSPLCTYINAVPSPDNILGNVYTFNYSNLQPGESRSIIVTITLPGPGTSVTNTLTVIARDIGNNIIAQDENFLQQTILCAMDPNDKTVIPEGVQAPHYTLMSDTLDFVIRFQNTGNDTAFKVVIVDTLDNAILDLSTFELIANSHPVTVDLRPNGIATFTFDNILLPDSNVNEPASHGFVRFRSLVQSGLPNNTVLNNTAHIYFDFNAAVVTNTTLNTLVYQIPVGINENNTGIGAAIIPNPVVKHPYISFDNPGRDKFTIRVLSFEGKLISEEAIYQSSYFSTQKILPAGIYIYELTSDSELHSRGKFVVAE